MILNVIITIMLLIIVLSMLCILSNYLGAKYVMLQLTKRKEKANEEVLRMGIWIFK